MGVVESVQFRAVVVFFALTPCACGSSRPTPLYPAPETPLSPSEVAALYGDVREVDGKVVSEHGGSFELLPGCHAVGLVENWGRVEQNGGVVVKLPRIVYAMPMKGGYRYVVEIRTNTTGGLNGGNVSIVAREEDHEGNVTRTFQPASDEEIGSCSSQAETG